MADERSGAAFDSLVSLLAMMAAAQFGDLTDPASGERRPPDLEGASHIIDLLGMLQEKTRGNLSPYEQQLLEDVLYGLRLRFVEAQQGGKRIIEP